MSGKKTGVPGVGKKDEIKINSEKTGFMEPEKVMQII